MANITEANGTLTVITNDKNTMKEVEYLFKEVFSRMTYPTLIESFEMVSLDYYIRDLLEKEIKDLCNDKNPVCYETSFRGVGRGDYRHFLENMIEISNTFTEGGFDYSPSTEKIRDIWTKLMDKGVIFFFDYTDLDEANQSFEERHDTVIFNNRPAQSIQWKELNSYPLDYTAENLIDFGGYENVYDYSKESFSRLLQQKHVQMKLCDWMNDKEVGFTLDTLIKNLSLDLLAEMFSHEFDQDAGDIFYSEEDLIAEDNFIEVLDDIVLRFSKNLITSYGKTESDFVASI